MRRTSWDETDDDSLHQKYLLKLDGELIRKRRKKVNNSG